MRSGARVARRPYPYYPAWDGGGPQPGTEKLLDLCKRRWGFKNLGIYANRPMRNPAAKGALSVHATGAAIDLGYDTRAKAVQAWDWFMAHTAELGIVELHDYAYGKWGRGYRCSRGEGAKGVKIYTAQENAGSPGGRWLHIELAPDMAKDAEQFETAWRALPRPPKL